MEVSIHHITESHKQQVEIEINQEQLISKGKQIPYNERMIQRSL
jgi:hypothetical protein